MWTCARAPGGEMNNGVKHQTLHRWAIPDRHSFLDRETSSSVLKSLQGQQAPHITRFAGARVQRPWARQGYRNRFPILASWTALGGCTNSVIPGSSFQLLHAQDGHTIRHREAHVTSNVCPLTVTASSQQPVAMVATGRISASRGEQGWMRDHRTLRE